MVNRACLVGGGGFLGTNLARHLLDHGYSVRVFGHPPRWPDALRECEVLTGNFQDTLSLRRAITNCDVIYHLAGHSVFPPAGARRLEDFELNFSASREFFDLAASRNVKIVFISSGGTVYGAPETLPVNEGSITRPLSPYGKSMLRIENLLHDYGGRYGLDYRIARVSNPFGPFQSPVRGQGVVAALLDAALRRTPFTMFGDGQVIRDYLFVEDVCDALRLLHEYTGEERVFNIGSGVGRSIEDMVALVEQVIGDSVIIERKPARELDVPKNVLDVTLARRHLNWKARWSMDMALVNTARWHQDELEAAPVQMRYTAQS